MRRTVIETRQLGPCNTAYGRFGRTDKRRSSTYIRGRPGIGPYMTESINLAYSKLKRRKKQAKNCDIGLF